MDRIRPDNPLADVARSRRNPAPVRIEAEMPVVVHEPEESRPRRRRQPRPQVAVPAIDDVTLRAMLSSRSGIRKAFILMEILGPPKALRRNE